MALSSAFPQALQGGNLYGFTLMAGKSKRLLSSMDYVFPCVYSCKVMLALLCFPQ